MLRSFYVALFVGLIEFALMGSAYALDCGAVVYRAGNGIYAAAIPSYNCKSFLPLEALNRFPNALNASVQIDIFNLSAKAAITPGNQLLQGRPGGSCNQVLIGSLGITLKYGQVYSAQYHYTGGVDTNDQVIDGQCSTNFSFQTPSLFLPKSNATPRVRTLKRRYGQRDSQRITWYPATGDIPSNITYKVSVIALPSKSVAFEKTVPSSGNGLSLHSLIVPGSQLKPSTSYKVKVVAVDAIKGINPLSFPIAHFLTSNPVDIKLELPTSGATPSISYVAEGVVKITWNPVTGDHSRNITYVVGIFSSPNNVAVFEKRVPGSGKLEVVVRLMRFMHCIVRVVAVDKNKNVRNNNLSYPVAPFKVV